MVDKLASLLAWLLLGCLAVGVLGLILPVILFALGFGFSVLAFYVLAWLLGRIMS
jgi:hypothetical protein